MRMDPCHNMMARYDCCEQRYRGDANIKQSGELMYNAQIHESDITDLQWAPDRSYLITASKDKTAKVSNPRLCWSQT